MVLNSVFYNIIRANCGFEEKCLFMIAKPDDEDFNEDPYYPFSRLIVYSLSGSDTWRAARYDLSITAINFMYYAKDDQKKLCVLSTEGNFLIRNKPEDIVEKIPGAGIEGDESGNGRLYGMSIINNYVYAYGESRQIYRRSDEGIWSMLDESIFQPLNTPISDLAIIYNVQGLHENEIYLIDSKGNIMLWDGVKTHFIQQIPDVRLVSLVIEDKNTVWIGGSDGTLLKGNHKQGFKQVSGIDENGTYNFVSMTLFQGKLYLASHGGGWDVGAYVYEDNQLYKLTTGLTPETEYDAHTVVSDHKDLWIVGLKDILHFDGNKWERIDFLGNPPIR